MDFLSSEYRWKIVEPEGTSLKGEWMKNKETCIQDFFDKNPGQMKSTCIRDSSYQTAKEANILS